ncbi:MAG: hypothetical protein LC776_14725, partial [Acidobacteria bacterium]|nr:hypothetical protein [Acidobacteriota bacterium]
VPDVDHGIDAQVVRCQLGPEPLNVDVQAFRVKRLVIPPRVFPQPSRPWASRNARPRLLT